MSSGNCNSQRSTDVSHCLAETQLQAQRQELLVFQKRSDAQMIQRLAKSFRIRLLGFGLQFCLSKRFVCCIMQTYEGGSELLDHFNKASVASIVTFLLC